MKLEVVMEKLYKFHFPNQKEAALTLIRFEEFYEGKDFKDRVFSRNEVLQYHNKHVINQFYHWNGYNFPNNTLNPFRLGDFNPLDEREEKFLEATVNFERDSYIIATSETKNILANGTLRHEIAHGLFYLNEEYKKSALEIVNNLSTQLRSRITRFIAARKYHDSVIEDEIHAFLISDSQRLASILFRTKELNYAAKQMNDLYDSFV